MLKKAPNHRKNEVTGELVNRTRRVGGVTYLSHPTLAFVDNGRSIGIPICEQGGRTIPPDGTLADVPSSGKDERRPRVWHRRWRGIVFEGQVLQVIKWSSSGISAVLVGDLKAGKLRVDDL